MTPQEAAVVLGKCAAYDNRRPDPATTAAWAEALDPNLTLADALAIVRDHYAESRDWIMPADINHRSRDIRRQRIKNAERISPVLPEGLEDEPIVERRWIDVAKENIRAGMPRGQAEARAWRAIGRTPPPELETHRHDIRPQLRKA